MAQCYTICLKWPSHAIGWSRQGTNSIRDAKWCVCVWEWRNHKAQRPSRKTHKSYAHTLSQVKKHKEPTPTLLCVECKSNQEPSFPCKLCFLMFSHYSNYYAMLATWVLLCEEVLFLVQGFFFLSIYLNPRSSLHLWRCLRPWDRGPFWVKSSTCDCPYPCC